MVKTGFLAAVLLLLSGIVLIIGGLGAVDIVSGGFMSAATAMGVRNTILGVCMVVIGYPWLLTTLDDDSFLTSKDNRRVE